MQLFVVTRVLLKPVISKVVNLINNKAVLFISL